MTAKRYFVTCEVGNAICDLISRKLNDNEFEHLTYPDIVNRLNKLTEENEQLKTENKKLNERIGILEGSLIDKGFDIND